jgi:hypothetical protein
MQEKKGGGCLILGHFYIVLNLEVGGRQSHSLSPVAFGPGVGSGGLMHTYTYANCQVCRSRWEEISTLI